MSSVPGVIPLKIKFTAGGTYTIKANCTAPDGSPYPITKTVTVSQMATPVINVSNYGYEWSGGMEVWRPYFYSTPWFTVQNPQSGLTYEWSINWPQLQSRTAAYAGMTHIMYLYPPDNDPGYTSDGIIRFSARCRAKTANGQYSAWSNLAEIMLNWNQVSYQRRRADSIRIANIKRLDQAKVLDRLNE